MLDVSLCPGYLVEDSVQPHRFGLAEFVEYFTLKVFWDLELKLEERNKAKIP